VLVERSHKPAPGCEAVVSSVSLRLMPAARLGRLISKHEACSRALSLILTGDPDYASAEQVEVAPPQLLLQDLEAIDLALGPTLTPPYWTLARREIRLGRAKWRRSQVQFGRRVP
jgi:hypothetical protein